MQQVGSINLNTETLIRLFKQKYLDVASDVILDIQKIQEWMEDKSFVEKIQCATSCVSKRIDLSNRRALFGPTSIFLVLKRNGDFQINSLFKRIYIAIDLLSKGIFAYVQIRMREYELCNHEVNVIKQIEQERQKNSDDWSGIVPTRQIREPIYSIKESLYKARLVQPLAQMNLEDWIAVTQKYETSSQKAQFVYDLIVSVQKMHRYGLVHRDLKPANLLLFVAEEEKLRLKISDLGFAVFLSDLPKNRYLHRVQGTFRYLDPCFATNTHGEFITKIRPENDIWALGVILIELYAIELDFLPKRKCLHPIPLQQMTIDTFLDQQTNIPVEVLGLVRKCLIINGQNRIRSDQLLTQELEEFFNQHKINRSVLQLT